MTPPEGTRTFAVVLALGSAVAMLLVFAVVMSGLFAVLFGEPLLWIIWLE